MPQQSSQRAGGATIGTRTSSDTMIVRKVNFSILEIHEFSTEIGGSSVPTDGCPIALSWNRVACHVCDVDYYENEKSKVPHRSTSSSSSSGFDSNKEMSSSSRKKNRAPVMSAHRRAKMLHANGYSVEEIIDVAIEMDNIRRQRRDSLENKRLDGFHYAMEMSGRTLKKVVTFKKPNIKRNVQSAKMA
jgi:hypothetical protein